MPEPEKPRFAPIDHAKEKNGGRLLFRARRGDTAARDELARRAASQSSTAAARAVAEQGTGGAA